MALIVLVAVAVLVGVAVLVAVAVGVEVLVKVAACAFRETKISKIKICFILKA